MATCNCKAFDAKYSEFQHEQRKKVICRDKSSSEYLY